MCVCVCVCVCVRACVRVFTLPLVLVGSRVRKHKNAEYTRADQRGEETSTEQHPGSRVSPAVSMNVHMYVL